MSSVCCCSVTTRLSIWNKEKHRRHNSGINFTCGLSFVWKELFVNTKLLILCVWKKNLLSFSVVRSGSDMKRGGWGSVIVLSSTLKHWYELLTRKVAPVAKSHSAPLWFRWRDDQKSLFLWFPLKHFEQLPENCFGLHLIWQW